MAGSEIKRGEIWLIDLGLAQKIRPAVVLSEAVLDHERALVTYVPRTTSIRKTRFEVTHTAAGFLPGVFDAQSLGTVPTVKLERRIGVLDPRTLALVEESVLKWLGISKKE